MKIVLRPGERANKPGLANLGEALPAVAASSDLGNPRAHGRQRLVFLATATV